MKTNIEELKRLAEAATPGPWIKRGYVLGIGCGVDGVTAVAHHTTSADAAYIAAANPAAVLELIRQRDELLAALKSVDNAAKEGKTPIGFAARAFRLLSPIRATIAKAEG